MARPSNFQIHPEIKRQIMARLGAEFNHTKEAIFKNIVEVLKSQDEDFAKLAKMFGEVKLEMTRDELENLKPVLETKGKEPLPKFTLLIALISDALAIVLLLAGPEAQVPITEIMSVVAGIYLFCWFLFKSGGIERRIIRYAVKGGGKNKSSLLRRVVRKRMGKKAAVTIGGKLIPILDLIPLNGIFVIMVWKEKSKTVRAIYAAARIYEGYLGGIEKEIILERKNASKTKGAFLDLKDFTGQSSYKNDERAPGQQTQTA